MTADTDNETNQNSTVSNDGGGYWDMNEPMTKTISKVSLTGFNKAAQQDETKEEHEEKKKGNSYWDWNESFLKKTLSSVSLGQLIGGGRNNNVDNPNKEITIVNAEEKPKSYWAWRNNSFASRSDLGSVGSEEQKESGEKPSYWFWRNPSMVSFSSATSLESADSENNNNKSISTPISTLDHKLRSSWRKSFQRLSSNSLKSLDEDTSNNEGSKTSTTWRQSFRSFRDSFANFPQENKAETLGREKIVEENTEQEKSIVVSSGSNEEEEEEGITF